MDPRPSNLDCERKMSHGRLKIWVATENVDGGIFCNIKRTWVGTPYLLHEHLRNRKREGRDVTSTKFEKIISGGRLPGEPPILINTREGKGSDKELAQRQHQDNGGQEDASARNPR